MRLRPVPDRWVPFFRLLWFPCFSLSVAAVSLGTVHAARETYEVRPVFAPPRPALGPKPLQPAQLEAVEELITSLAEALRIARSHHSRESVMQQRLDEMAARLTQLEGGGPKPEPA